MKQVNNNNVLDGIFRAVTGMGKAGRRTPKRDVDHQRWHMCLLVYWWFLGCTGRVVHCFIYMNWLVATLCAGGVDCWH